MRRSLRGNKVLTLEEHNEFMGWLKQIYGNDDIVISPQKDDEIDTKNVTRYHHNDNTKIIEI